MSPSRLTFPASSLARRQARSQRGAQTQLSNCNASDPRPHHLRPLAVICFELLTHNLHVYDHLPFLSSSSTGTFFHDQHTMSTPKIFSIHGKGLKLDSRADVEPLLAGVDPALVEEVRLSGNTIGVEAAHALAEFLVKATKLKVCLSFLVS
jgi:hypothetical protein